MTAPVHFIELYADRGEIAPRLVCIATPDALCRRRPVNPDAETWTEGDETTPGHDCWATEFIDGVGFDESVTWAPESGVLVRVPVNVSYDHRGVLAAPVALPDPADLLPVTADGTYRPSTRVTTADQLDALPVGTLVSGRSGMLFRANGTLGPTWYHYPSRDHAADSTIVAEVEGALTVLFRPDAPQPAVTHSYCANCEGVDPASCINAEPATTDAAVEAALARAEISVRDHRESAAQCEDRGDMDGYSASAAAADILERHLRDLRAALAAAGAGEVAEVARLRVENADKQGRIQAVFDTLRQRDPFAPEGAITTARIRAALNTPPTSTGEAVDREALAEVIWNASRADEGTISAIGARKVADAVLALFPDTGGSGGGRSGLASLAGAVRQIADDRFPMDAGDGAVLRKAADALAARGDAAPTEETRCLQRDDAGHDVCDQSARYVVWGHLYEKSEKGPRCRRHLPQSTYTLAGGVFVNHAIYEIPPARGDAAPTVTAEQARTIASWYARDRWGLSVTEQDFDNCVPAIREWLSRAGIKVAR